MPEYHDVVVIGGGQAGLVMSAVLRERGREHVVLERDRIGERWRTERWDSLRFQFPNWSLELPGWQYSGIDPDGFAHWSEILAVIEAYAKHIRAPVREHTEVLELRADGDGFLLEVADGAMRAGSVVLATGPFQRPRIPRLAAGVPPSVLQLDPTHYRRPDDLPDGAVLVVGSGASGCQIADELTRAGRPVFLSVSRHRRVPRRFRGKDLYWWLDSMGRFAQTIDSFPERTWPPSTVVTGVDGGYDIDVRQMAAGGGVHVLGRVLAIAGRTVTLAADAEYVLDEADSAFAAFVDGAREFAAAHPELDLDTDDVALASADHALLTNIESLDLQRENVATIVWATGYEYDYGWLHAPVIDDRGRPVHRRGVTGVTGLYFLGLHWMHTFKSGLFSGVGSDAEFLAGRMT